MDVTALVDELLDTAGLPTGGSDVKVTGSDPVIATPFRVGEAAAAALAAGAVAAVQLHTLRGGQEQHVAIDVAAAAASLVGFGLQRLETPAGAVTPERPAAISPLVALYECGDGRWIHLHGAFPSLSRPTLKVLGCEPDRASVAAAVASWKAQELEDALAEARTCGAMVRTAAQWQAHPQGRAVAALGTLEVRKIADSPPEPLPASERPLGGVRVLDLTRILAGPTHGRTLASYGADVLLVNSPDLPNVEPFVMDTGHGKLSTFIDLAGEAGRATLAGLVRGCDVFAQGYRAGALERRGFGVDELVALRPGIISVSINCYGDAGPWRARPGWEQLAQSVTGIAHEQGGDGPPVLIPAAATDYTTGYLAALGTMAALVRRSAEGGSYEVRASLCQTGAWIDSLQRADPAGATGFGDTSPWMTESDTPFGRLTHLRPVVDMAPAAPRWARPTVPLGTHPAEWPARDISST